MAEKSDLLPGYAACSVAVMPLSNTERFCEVPNPDWLKRRMLVSEKDITRIFMGLQNKEAGFRIGPTSFAPRNCGGVKVYVDFQDKSSLFIVAESEEIADRYVTECLGLKKKPYNTGRKK